MAQAIELHRPRAFKFESKSSKPLIKKCRFYNKGLRPLVSTPAKRVRPALRLQDQELAGWRVLKIELSEDCQARTSLKA